MSDAPQPVARTDRTTVKRFAPRGTYERDTIHRILDACLMAHIGFVHENSSAVLPMMFWRVDDHVYFHGQRRNRMLTDLRSGECCFVATSLDGLVLSRRAVQHSANYRCVIIYGRPEEIIDVEAKRAAMRDGLFGRLYPGRWEEIRQPTEAELGGLSVMRLKIDEASAKVREGPPFQQDEDVQAWAGVVPIRTIVGDPIPDVATAGRIPVPAYATHVATFLGVGETDPAAATSTDPE